MMKGAAILATTTAEGIMSLVWPPQLAPDASAEGGKAHDQDEASPGPCAEPYAAKG